MDTQEIKKEAIFFKKEPLPTYHIKVNEASQAICLRKPCMLRRRGELLVQVKQSVHDTGYVYRKGKSRSKSYGSAVDDATRPKRVKTSADERISRMKTIKEELSDLQNRVSFKRKRLDAAEVTKNYKLCDQLSEEIADLNKSKRLLEVELDMLQKKEKKSKRYYQRKRESDSDSSSSQMSSSSTASRSTWEGSSPFSPPAKKASPGFTSPPPLSVSAPSTPRPVSPFQHVHSISSCPRQVSPQQEADISSVGTDQATPQRQGSSDQIDEPVAQSTSDEQSLQQAFSGVQESCKEAAASSQSF